MGEWTTGGIRRQASKEKKRMEENGKELPVKLEENMGRIFTEAYRRQS